MSSAKGHVVYLGRAIADLRHKLPKTNPPVVFSTREVYGALDAAGVFSRAEISEAMRWKMLAKLADYEFPGVRRGAETESAWKGHKRKVRPLEWHHVPTQEEMTAWEAKVHGHKAAGPVASLAERVERLERQVKELLAGAAAPVQ